MIIVNPKNKKHFEAMIKYCKDNGLEPLSLLGFQNHLVRLFKRLEKAEERIEVLENIKTTLSLGGVEFGK